MKRSFSNKNAKIENEEKMKFDKIWGEHNEGSPSNEIAEIQTF